MFEEVHLCGNHCEKYCGMPYECMWVVDCKPFCICKRGWCRNKDDICQKKKTKNESSPVLLEFVRPILLFK